MKVSWSADELFSRLSYLWMILQLVCNVSSLAKLGKSLTQSTLNKEILFDFIRFICCDFSSVCFVLFLVVGVRISYKFQRISFWSLGYLFLHARTQENSQQQYANITPVYHILSGLHKSRIPSKSMQTFNDWKLLVT